MTDVNDVCRTTAVTERDEQIRSSLFIRNRGVSDNSLNNRIGRDERLSRGWKRDRSDVGKRLEISP